MLDEVVANHRLSHVSTTSSTNSKRVKAHIGPWQLGKTLGRGSSGRVRLAKHMETGKLAAVKIVPKSQIVDNTSGTPQKSSEAFGIEREVIIMKLIEHPNIMTLYDVWENKGELYLVLEYIEGGELFDYLISRGRLSEREAIHYFRQICYGVEYCHKFNICHRDLKPENLLLDKHRNIKIADFGMAALESNGRLLETSCGSPHYASPEIVTGKNYHGAPSDIWSCGIILFALLTGHLPFDDDNIRQLLLKVQAGKFTMPQSLSWEAQDLISRMLVVNPKKRITMREIFSHPLMTKYPLRRVPIENIDRKASKIDVTQPITKIDPEILRNLQILWHHDSREYLISRLRRPEPNTEKTFYSLLLRFRQRHGLSNRETIPRNRSAASIRSLRSSKSVRSVVSMNSKPGSLKSLKSVRSNRSGLSVASRRKGRYSPAKHHKHHHHKRQNSSAPADHQDVSKSPSPKKSNNTTSNNEEKNVFAQLLDEAFNHQSHDGNNANISSSKTTPAVDDSISSPNPSLMPDSPLIPNELGVDNLHATNNLDTMYSARHASYAPRSNDYFGLGIDRPYSAPLSRINTHYDSDAISVGPNSAPHSARNTFNFDTGNNKFSSLDFEISLPDVSLNVPKNDTAEISGSGDVFSQSKTTNGYLLPMIFEEDRFADAIEEEVDMKVYNRPKTRKLPNHPDQKKANNSPQFDFSGDSSANFSSEYASTLNSQRGNTSNMTNSSGSQPGDNSQLQIHNLVAGETFLSYKPSPAAASISAPVRPAPKAPTGPRDMAQRKSVPIYVDADSDSSQGDVTPPARVPLAPLPETHVRRDNVQDETEQLKQQALKKLKEQKEQEAALNEMKRQQLKKLQLEKEEEQFQQMKQHHFQKLQEQRKEREKLMQQQKRQSVETVSSRPASQPVVTVPASEGTQSQLQSGKSEPQQITVSKRGDKDTPAALATAGVAQKEKKSWIRRLTPRIVSRKSSKPEVKSPVATPQLPSSNQLPSPVEPSSNRISSNSGKENIPVAPNQRVKPVTHGSKQVESPRSRQVSFEEPRQNWFMKFLSTSTQSSSRTLMSSCQPIELRAIILEVLSEWMPHGLALYSDGSRGEPISIAILRNNTLKLKPARLSINIKPSYTMKSSARLVHESGARSSFFTFASEFERRLSENHVLGV